MKAGLPSALVLAAVSAVVALLLAPRNSLLPSSLAALLAVGVPTLLAPLFWPRVEPSGARLLIWAVAPTLASVVVAAALWILRGAAPALPLLARAGLVAVLLLAAAHQLSALIEPVVRRLGASAASAREWSCWTVTALLWLAAAAPVWLGPLADLGARTQPHLPTVILGASPLAHLAVAAGFDLLRDQWFYAHSSLGALQVDYPRLPALLLGYVIGNVVLTLGARVDARASCGLLLLVALGGAAGEARSAAPLEVEVVPAWGGWSRPGRITEIELRLRSEQQDTVELVVHAGASRVRAQVPLEPGQQSRQAIPVPADEVITIETDRDGPSRERREVRLSLSESPLLAWVTLVPAPAATGAFHFIALEPGQLPGNSAAWSSIDALVLEHRLVPSLEQDQLAALLAYLAGCGRAVLVSDAPGDEGLLRAAVGCGGQGFAVAANGVEAIAQLDRITAASIASMPEARSLRSVSGPDLQAWYLVVTLLALCAAASVILGIFTSSLPAAVGAPAVLAVLALAYLQTRAVHDDLTVWAEAGAGERVARFAGLQHVTALHRGHVEMPVLGALARPQACRADERVTWTWDAEAHRYKSARFDGRLFASASLCYSGEFPVARAVAVRPAPGNRIALFNTGASSLPAGDVAWNGRLYPVAALEAGREVEVDPASGSTAQDGARAMALSRTPLDAQSVLWPLDLQRVAGAPDAARAWLLLRVGTREPG